ncbi:MAG: hypothetical protein PWR10_2395 [Halanaerobiales bacterium]|nr:hypothetical protein [Halanaerobiales bacterium]
MLKKVETELFCIECEEETVHTVIYLDNKIQRVKCNKCGSVFGIDHKKLIELHTLSTAEHILKEPFKLNKELKEKGTQFLFSLPKRLLTKPYRITKEFLEILND